MLETLGLVGRMEAFMDTESLIVDLCVSTTSRYS